MLALVSGLEIAVGYAFGSHAFDYPAMHSAGNESAEKYRNPPRGLDGRKRNGAARSDATQERNENCFICRFHDLSSSIDQSAEPST